MSSYVRRDQPRLSGVQSDDPRQAPRRLCEQPIRVRLSRKTFERENCGQKETVFYFSGLGMQDSCRLQLSWLVWSQHQVSQRNKIAETVLLPDNSFSVFFKAKLAQSLTKMERWHHRATVIDSPSYVKNLERPRLLQVGFFICREEAFCCRWSERNKKSTSTCVAKQTK